jgi:hypothetical protein
MKKLLIACLLAGTLYSCKQSSNTAYQSLAVAASPLTNPGTIPYAFAQKIVINYHNHVGNLQGHDGVVVLDPTTQRPLPNSRAVWVSLERLNEIVHQLDIDSLQNHVTDGVRIYLGTFIDNPTTPETGDNNLDASCYDRNTLIFVSTKTSKNASGAAIHLDYIPSGFTGKPGDGFCFTNVPDKVHPTGDWGAVGKDYANNGDALLYGSYQHTPNTMALSGSITKDMAKKMASNYIKFQMGILLDPLGNPVLDTSGNEQPNTSSIWFSKQRFDKLVYQLNTDRVNDNITDGVRFYFATYGNNADSDAVNAGVDLAHSYRNTLVLASTQTEGNIHVDNYKPATATAKAIGFFVRPMDDIQNKGELCPPGDCCDDGATLSCDALSKVFQALLQKKKQKKQ